MVDDEAGLPTTVVVLRGTRVVASWPIHPSTSSPTGRLDLGAVEELARLQLGARRLGLSVELRDVCPRLRELLELVGLAGAGAGAGGGLPLQPGGEAEGGEQLGVQEAVEPGDQPV